MLIKSMKNKSSIKFLNGSAERKLKLLVQHVVYDEEGQAPVSINNFNNFTNKKNS